MRFLPLFLVFLFPPPAKAVDFTLMQKVVRCESSIKHRNVWGDGGASYGIAQFNRETFYRFAHEAKTAMKAAHLWPANWFNQEHQMFLLGWGLDHGKGDSWTCYKKVKGD